MMHRLSVLAGVALLAGGLMPSTSTAAISYTDVNVPGGTLSQVNGINGNGLAVGYGTLNGAIQNFTVNINAPSTVTLLTITGPPNYGYLFGINDTNEVVGQTTAGVAFKGTLSGATVTPTQLGSPLPPAIGTTQGAFGLNNAGTIVGQFTDLSTGITHGVVNNGTAYTNIAADAGVAGAVSNALTGINNSGLAVGYYFDANGGVHGYEYNTVSQTATLITDPTGSTYAQFNAINNLGQEAGFYVDGNGVSHGFIYSGGANGTYTFIDEPNAGKAGGQGTAIYGLDDKGDFAGFYLDADNVQRGFVATRGTGVPEPASLALLGLGLTGALGFARRRKSA